MPLLLLFLVLLAPRTPVATTRVELTSDDESYYAQFLVPNPAPEEVGMRALISAYVQEVLT